MDCKKVKEELVFLACDRDREPEFEQDWVTAFKRHLSHCPDCARKAEVTQALITIVRTRAHRRCAPRRLRIKILDRLQIRIDGPSH